MPLNNRGLLNDLRRRPHQPATGSKSRPENAANHRAQAPNQRGYSKHLIVIYNAWFTFLTNTMRENAHGETDPR